MSGHIDTYTRSQTLTHTYTYRTHTHIHIHNTHRIHIHKTHTQNTHRYIKKKGMPPLFHYIPLKTSSDMRGKDSRDSNCG